MLIEIQRDPFDGRITVAIWRNRNHPRRSIAFDMIDYPDNDRIRVTQIDNSRPPGDPGRVDSYFISFDELKAKLFPPATPPEGAGT